MDDRENEIRRARMRDDKLNSDLESLLKSIEKYERLTNQVEEKTRAIKREIFNRTSEKNNRTSCDNIKKTIKEETNTKEKSMQQQILKIKKGIDELLEQIETTKKDLYEQQVKRNQLWKSLSGLRAKQQDKQTSSNKENLPDNVTISKAKSPPKITRHGGGTGDKRLSKKNLLSPTLLEYHS